MNFETTNNDLIYPVGTDTKALRLFSYNQDVIRAYLPSYKRVNAEKLFKSLTAYLIYNYDYKCDLFGFTEIDLRELCEDYLGTSSSNLNSKLDPTESYSYQEIRNKLEDKGFKGQDLENKINEEITLIKKNQDYELIFFDSVFDDFLNRLLSKKIKYNIVTRNSDVLISENTAHSFLDALKIVQDRQNKNKKRYLIKLSDFYIKSLNTSFLFQKTDSIKKLLRESKGNTRAYDLYCFLTSIKEKCRQQKLATYKLPFETLISQLNLYDNNSAKAQKQKINKYLEDVTNTCEHLDFEYKWIKNTSSSKYNYALYLVFDLKGYQNLNLFKVKEKDFHNLVKLYYYSYYVYVNRITFIEQENEKREFSIWFNDKNRDKEEKLNLFSKAFYEIFNTPLNGYFKEALYHGSIEFTHKTLKELKEYNKK